jgi:hypothetical protein
MRWSCDVGLIEIVEAHIARLKGDRIAIDDHLNTLQAELVIAKAALSGGEMSKPLTGRGVMIREDSLQETREINQAIKHYRKRRAPRGSGESNSARILSELETSARYGERYLSARAISARLELDGRAVSFAMQGLKKAGKVTFNGHDWSLAGDPTADTEYSPTYHDAAE